jgi:hypothetical protein
MATTQVYRFRSELEKLNAKYLQKKRVKFEYETLKIEFIDPRIRKYTPDFILPNGIIVETKGWFKPHERNKHLWIKQIHPELDIRFVFSNPYQRLNKGAKMTYAGWCDRHGFIFAKKVIPHDWIKERKKKICLNSVG